MKVWWAVLTLFQKLMFIFAIPTTIVFVVFLGIMMFYSQEQRRPFIKVNSLKIMAIKFISIFLVMFSWLSFFLNYYGSIGNSLLLGTLGGFIAGYVLIVTKREEFHKIFNKNYEVTDLPGMVGLVMQRIEANRTSIGQIIIRINNKNTKLFAISDDDFAIPVGSDIQIVDIFNERTMIVQKIEE